MQKFTDLIKGCFDEFVKADLDLLLEDDLLLMRRVIFEQIETEIRLILAMRSAQKQFFKHRSDIDLKRAITLEAQVDELLSEFSIVDEVHQLVIS